MSASDGDLVRRSGALESIQSTSRPNVSVSMSISSMDGNQLESVINNYNRICSLLPHNSYNDWLQSFYDLMKSEWTRLRSFTARPNSKWTLDFVTPEELANSGFFFLNGDRVQCAFCRGIVSGWERGDRPLAEHARHFPRCPFIMEEDVGNQPIGDDPIRGPKNRLNAGHDVCGNYSPIQMLNNIGVNNRNGDIPNDMKEYGVHQHYGPKNSNYKTIDARRRSFAANGWDPRTPVQCEQLAEAGFYSIGMSDYVKCFYCDGGLCNWETGDDPWVEHAKWFPDCRFVSLNKGQEFIEECKRLAEAERANQLNISPAEDSEMSSPSDSDEENIDALGLQVINQWMNSDIVIELIRLNSFPTDVIRAVLNKRWHDERQPFTTFVHLYEAVNQWRTEPMNPTISRNPIQSNATEEYVNSISSEEEYNSGSELPSSQSSLSSTTSTLSTYSSSPVESSVEMMSSESSQSPSQKEDNRLLCKICFDREIGVVFLPCGHNMACTQCAACVTDCPICRKVIRGTVRTFFS